LLVTKNLLSKEEVRGLYQNASANLEPVNDPDVVRAREVLKEYADSMPDSENAVHTMPRLIKFPDGRSVRPVDIARVSYNYNLGEETTWVVRVNTTGGDDWVYKSVATEEEAQALCSKLTDEVNETA
jgi:hypothetical protein